MKSPRNLNGYNRNVAQFDRILLTQAIFDTLLSLSFPFCCAYMAISYHLNITVGEVFSNSFMTYGFPYFLYPLSGIARYASSLSTVSMTIERFCSITLPLKKLDLLKKSLIPLTIIFSILMGVPRFFEVLTWMFKYFLYLEICCYFTWISVGARDHGS